MSLSPLLAKGDDEFAEDDKMEQQHQLQQSPSRRRKGGLITMPFILANEALEQMASLGLSPNMILYFMEEYNIGVAQGTTILFYTSAASNFLPVVGAFLADSYLGRFLTIGFGSISSLLGMFLLWLTAMIPQARPPHCNQQLKEKCKPPTSSQFTLLLSCFAFMSIGTGGVRPCSLAFGADQLDTRNNSKNENNSNNSRVLEKFFSWYFAAAGVAAVVAFTGIVYIQDRVGWKLGFGVPAILMFLSALLFFLASPFYIKQKATTSLLTSFSQVVVAAYKNRKVGFPLNGGYHHKKDSSLLEPTDKLRFLNKACIIKNLQDVTPDGVATNLWRVCTVDQVEDLKSLIRIIPLWSTGIMMIINMNQGSFLVLQAQSMDRQIISSFQIPAGSFVMFIIIGAVIWIVLYDRVILPLASKIRGKPVKFRLKTRMGLGLFCSFLAMVVSAFVEHVRRRKVISSGFLDHPKGVVAMSAMWLVPQYFLNGMAEALNTIGQNEFFYTELPKSMSSIATSMGGLAGAVGGLLASFILNTVTSYTKRGGKEGWIADDINKGHYDNYFWLLAVMSFVNLLYFLLCSWAYGPSSDEGVLGVGDGREDLKEEEEFGKIGSGDRINGGEGSKGGGMVTL